MPAAGAKPDDALGDDEIVLRRVPLLAPSTRADGKREVSKGAFSASSKDRDPEQGMSADQLSVLLAQGIDLADRAQFAPDCEVIMALRVGDLHAHGMWVVPRRAPGPAHCNILGVTKSKRKTVLELATFYRRPEDVVKAGE